MPEFFEEPVRIFAEILNKDPLESRQKACYIIHTLTSYVEGKAEINNSQISELVDELMCFSIYIPMPIPLVSGAFFTRAVKYNLNDGNKGYGRTSDLSYIPDDKRHLARVNRLSKAGSPTFYASLNDDLNSIGAVLAECNAEKGDVFNILISTTKSGVEKTDIHVMPLGIFDYFRRGVASPFQLDGTYRKVYDLAMSKLHHDAKVATQLCDAFLTDMLKRSGSDRLYSVTSEFAKFCFNQEVIDGVIYPSTRLEGHPNLALKPKSVDHKLEYQKALSVRVLEVFGYGMCKLQNLGIGTLQDDVINWVWHPNADDSIS